MREKDEEKKGKKVKKWAIRRFLTLLCLFLSFSQNFNEEVSPLNKQPLHLHTKLFFFFSRK